MPTKNKVAKKTAKAKKVVKKPAKKAVKKANKKTTNKVAKKATRSKKPTKTLMYTSDEVSFWVSDGQILNSLAALSEALDIMSKDIYTFHAKGEENDFANWVEVVLCDEQCAKDLRNAKTQRSAKTAVTKHLKTYEA